MFFRTICRLDKTPHFPTLSATQFVTFCTNCSADGAKTMAEPDQPGGGSGGGGDFRGLAYGLQILVGVGLGYLVGLWLQRRFGWSQAVVVCSLVGLAGGLYLLIKDAIRINKD